MINLLSNTETMGRNEIHTNISELLRKISQLNEALKESTMIHPAEIELLSIYCNELGNEINRLKNETHGTASVPEEKQAQETGDKDQETAEVQPQETTKELKPGPPPPVVHQENQETESTPVVAEKEAQEAAEKTTSPGESGSIDKDKTSDIPFTSRGIDLNERFKKSAEDLVEKLRKKPLSRLKGNIDLAHKFLFTSELFNGDSDAFERAIRTIDDCNTYDEAKRYIEEKLRAHYQWDKEQKQEAVSIFWEFIDRKFGITT